MSVPAVFVGAWQRRSIAVGDDPASESLDVIWVQTGPGPFADIRVDRATGVPVACFAGTTTWSAPRLTWHHELDLAPIGRPDVGAVSWRDGDLVETGALMLDGAPVAYTEVWRRLPPAVTPAGPVEAERSEGRVRVRVGHHQITVDDRRPAGGTFTADYTVDGRVTLAVDTRRVPPTVDPLRGITDAEGDR